MIFIFLHLFCFQLYLFHFFFFFTKYQKSFKFWPACIFVFDTLFLCVQTWVVHLQLPSDTPWSRRSRYLGICWKINQSWKQLSECHCVKHLCLVLPAAHQRRESATGGLSGPVKDLILCRSNIDAQMRLLFCCSCSTGREVGIRSLSRGRLIPLSAAFYFGSIDFYTKVNIFV